MKGLNVLLCRPLFSFYRPLPAPPLAPANSLFKSEAFLPGDVAKKFFSPCTRGFSSASEPAAIRNRFGHLPSPCHASIQASLSWLHWLQENHPKIFLQKTVEEGQIPVSWKSLIAPGQEWESKDVGMLLFSLKNKSPRAKVYWNGWLAIFAFGLPGRYLRACGISAKCDY